MEKSLSSQTNACIKIAITGPESSGKTTLARSLAQALGCHWVPEYAREYLNQYGSHYRSQDILEIAKGQFTSEDKLEQSATQYLVCDTDTTVLKVWYAHFTGQSNEWLDKQFNKRMYSIRFLCRPDITWEPDPLREHPHLREHLYQLYIQALQGSSFSFYELSGSLEERLKYCQQVIANFLSATQ